MRLAKLVLAGFKSFADRTEFSFDDDITGVVGPNGCGKSNVVDAIKWVLGERSSKSLRGKEMIDVIFAGSAGRSPSGMASVTLGFDNPVINPDGEIEEIVPSDAAGDDTDPAEPRRARPGALRKRGLPMDEDYIEVERRLYRDGTSQYLINNRKARLRDIRELFLDTGIGADAYSIIEQGKVDAMLLASPQERRTIFEEAAGIAKYKQRRIESMRKLDRTEVNLTRAREQLDSTERRLRIVRGQAGKARKFVELDTEYKAIRAALAFDQYDDLRQRLDGLTSRLRELESTRDEANASVADLEGAKQDAEIERHRLNEAHRSSERDLMSAQHASEAAKSREQAARQTLAEAQARFAEDEKALEHAAQERDRASARVEEHQASVQRAEGDREDAEREVAEASDSRAQAVNAVGERRAELTERRTQEQGIERERSGLEASIQGDRRRVESMREQLAAIESRLDQARQGEEDANRQLESDASAIESMGEQLGRLSSELTDLDTRADQSEAGRQSVAATVNELDQRRVGLDSRRQTLQELIDSRAGFVDAVRDVLDARDAGEGFSGVRGALADLVEADAQHASVVEAALGSNLQGLVVRSVTALPSTEELDALSGRVTFLPAAGLGETVIAHGAEAESLLRGGHVVPVRRLVHPTEADSGLHELLDRLLTSTYLVEDLDTALLLSGGVFEKGARFVSRAGRVLEPDGRVVAGPAVEGADTGGMLGRRAELAELHASLHEVDRELAEKRDELDHADRGVAELQRERTELRGRVAEVERSLAAGRAKLERLESESGRLARETQSLVEEQTQASARLVALESEREASESRLGKLTALLSEQRSETERAEHALATAESESEQAGERVAVARVRAGSLAEQLGAARRELAREEEHLQQADRALQDIRHRMAGNESSIDASRQSIERAEEEAKSSDARAVEVSELLAKVERDLTEADASLSQLGERLGAAREQARRVERDWHALESGRREIEVRREHLEERTLDELSIDLEREYDDYREMMSGGDVERLDTEASEQLADELKHAIDALGNVNLDAIEEETQLESRNEDLIEQVADLDRSRESLVQLIEELNEASVERFQETFDRVREHFGGNDGMFRKLFGGGKAEVRLMPLIKEIDGEKVQTDEIDLLESGIEVVARPPGKEPRSISQLSGGEKTMTAVALLLSIFKSKPSCFCVLDEVDAALDDANVDRYCRVVREFADTSHFIVITHNKRSMQEADRLYGVTMQERGVSKRVTVRVDDVSGDGTIDAGAIMRAEASEPEPPSLRGALASMRAGTPEPVNAS